MGNHIKNLANRLYNEPNLTAVATKTYQDDLFVNKTTVHGCGNSKGKIDLIIIF